MLKLIFFVVSVALTGCTAFEVRRPPADYIFWYEYNNKYWLHLNDCSDKALGYLEALTCRGYNDDDRFRYTVIQKSGARYFHAVVSELLYDGTTIYHDPTWGKWAQTDLGRWKIYKEYTAKELELNGCN